MKPALQLHAVTPARQTILVSLLLLAVIAAAPAAAKKIPVSAWQTGTLRNVTNDTQSHVFGWTSHNGAGHVGEKVQIIWHYTIDAGQYIYEAEGTTKRLDEGLDVTVNAPVKFAVIGMDLYLQDDAGKVHNLAIVSKTLKTKNEGCK